MKKNIWEKSKGFSSLKSREEYIFRNFVGVYKNSNSYKIKKIKEVVSEIKDAIKRNLPIKIVGDYDVDGITSTAELCILISGLGAKNFNYYIPKRISDGYGLSVNIVNKFLTGTPGLLITVDNGIAAPEAINKAKELGWRTIIIDHHLITGEIAEADIIIDPNALPGTASFTKYCAAGLVYKIAQSIPDFDKDALAKITSFAALGTVCDSVALIEKSGDSFVYDNYLIVKEGLHTILQNNGRTTGLYCLLRMLNKDIKIDEEDLGFTVGPVLNAMSRMKDDGATDVVELLLKDGPIFNECDKLARVLIENNDERKEITRNIEPILIEEIEKNNWQNDFPIVVSADIPRGLVGLIAARISERYNTSCIVFTNEDNMSGSARAPEGCDIKAALDKCSDLIVTYGGHPLAAGVTILKENIDKFRERIKKASGKKPAFLNLRKYDFNIMPKDIKNELSILKEYKPFGEGHPKPTYKVENFICKKEAGKFYSIIGATKETLKLNGLYANALSFKGNASEYQQEGCPLRLDLYGTLSENTWNGKTEPQILFTEFEMK